MLNRITKTNLISFWRVIFTYQIAIHHLYNRYAVPNFWMIGVEFFFIVSGYLLAEKAEKTNYSAYEYTALRIKRLFPEYVAAFLLCSFAIRYSVLWNSTNNWNIGFYKDWFLLYGYKELLMIHYWPWGGDYKNMANIPTWYISVMLFCGLILYSLYRINKKLLCEVIIPLLIMFFYTISFKKYGNFTEDEYLCEVLSLKMIRGFTEMGIGILLHELSKKVEIKSKTLYGIVGFIALSIVCILSMHNGGYYNYIYTILIAIGVFCSFNYEIVNGNRVISMFSALSYSIYLNHNFVRLYVIPVLFDRLNSKVILLYLLIITMFAFAMHTLILSLGKVIRLFVKIGND
ncbi:acyltransferase family protein [Pseudobutyrivibrio sp. MD2005]|uniref:acyltransferase family protein n=1 Tax=Pseudobutyrivibrio sp. MD2005 TaxID=1410616 RepID=UPI00048459F6|nr:acyltransferase family protein [Pseudobutyrivibrio sp. MD2005]